MPRGKRSVFNKVLFFVILIGVPFSLVYMLAQGKPSFSDLPFFGPEKYITTEVDGQRRVDTVPYTINDFSFITIDGKTVTKEMFSGKNTLVFSTLYTSCPFNCAINSTMFDKIAYQEVLNIKDLKDVIFLTRLISPGKDTVDSSGLENLINPDKDRWMWYVTDNNVVFDIDFPGGNPTQVNPTDFPGGAAADGVILLVDKNMRIRGVYEGVHDTEIRRLRDDLWVLNKKEKQHAKRKKT